MAGATLELLTVPAVFLGGLVGTRLLIGSLTRRNVLDRPNERSSHAAPVPRGGGIAVVASIALGFLWLEFTSEVSNLPDRVMIAVAVALAVLSFLDDLKGLGPVIRFAAHAAAVAVGMIALGEEARLFSGVLPDWADITLTALAWLWFLNLFNFMDGIDGISVSETVAICIGLSGLALFGIASPSVLLYAQIIAAAALGFSLWNWHPARIFLGDVGSVPLGFLLGWLLIQTAATHPPASGGWMAVAILPAYYLADATITLLRRAARGERVWQAHREHFYQQAVISGRSHDRVCQAILIANAGLVALALNIAPHWPWPALAAAVFVVAVLLVWMRAPMRWGPRP
ncbi:MAG: glycosyltransferase family 4 protein [Rhodospirillaceae bacterium]|jgi:UDP-N-acetylmuramyl pentapeptide phosphotransferase/UDP-N-acetylglucosamine-1-phosphate transferase|nr:glycosyltransferase family 4 protein [Rhodospirillaceae bacterium]MBT6136628.1 glycosyltransferase family 4 protein [Rhodospirillaceae bacterium]